jgi:hypothetical protein
MSQPPPFCKGDIFFCDIIKFIGQAPPVCVVTTGDDIPHPPPTCAGPLPAVHLVLVFKTETEPHG